MPPETTDSGARDDSPASIEEVYERVRELGKENEQILGTLIAGEGRFRRLAKAVWQVQEDERRRLARELHDGIGQTLTAVKNHLEWMQQAPDPDDQGANLGEAVGLVSQALDDTRELSRLLRPPVLDDLGLAPALRWLGRTVSKRFGLEVEVDSEDPEPRPAPELETVLFRIAQEALTNAAKHARASEVQIRLAREGTEFVLSIEDDGRGFDVERRALADDRTGIGLRGMRDRVELFEGSFDIRSRPGEGTHIVARLPVTSPSRP